VVIFAAEKTLLVNKVIRYCTKIFIYSIILLTAIDGVSQISRKTWGTSPFQDSIWSVDTNTYSVVQRLAPSLAGYTITGITGMAKNPNSGTVYVVAKISAVTGRTLLKIDLPTAVCTLVGSTGNLGQNFSSITFQGDTLWGATGNGSTNPETLFRIDTLTGTPTLVFAMGNGADGEVILYNPNDQNMYHWSGNGTVVFEKWPITNTTYTPINIPITGTPGGETFGAVYINPNYYIVSNISSSFKRWNPNGTVAAANLASLPDDLRGLVFNDCSRFVSLTGNDSVCAGDSTMLDVSTTGMSINSYQWYKDNVLIPGATSANYYASASGVYNCIFDIKACGLDSVRPGGVRVTVVQPPVVTINNSGNDSICANSSVVLTAPNGASYQWYLNGSAINGETNMTCTAAAGMYNVVVTNSFGCSDSAAVATTIVDYQPTVTITSGITSVCAGDSTLLTAGNSGTYQWYMNGSPVNGATNMMYYASQAGTYNVIETNYLGCSDSAATGVSITVNSLPVVNVNTNDTSICVGDSTLLTGTSGGSSQWYLNGQPISGATSNTYYASQAGTYNMIKTNQNGCSDSASVGITIVVNPLPTVTFGAPQNPCINWPAFALNTGSPSGGTYSGSGVSGGVFNPSVAGVGTHTLTYTYTDINGCSNSATTTITVNPCTGIEQYENGINQVVFQNPFENTLTLYFETDFNDNTITVYNSIGEIVMSVIVTEKNITLNTATLKSGIYFIQISSPKGITSYKAIKQ
jgi:hypothetical protein